ncbi:MAG: hypothetical protein ACLFQV_06495 [Vulcanimicrobiota bacterium]
MNTIGKHKMVFTVITPIYFNGTLMMKTGLNLYRNTDPYIL